MTEKALLRRIVIDPKVMLGKPVIREHLYRIRVGDYRVSVKEKA